MDQQPSFLRPQNAVRGTCFALATFFSTALIGVVVKWLPADTPSTTIGFFQFFIALLLTFPWALKREPVLGTTRWSPEPQNPTSCFASSSRYQRTISSPFLLCRYFLCAIGGCQSSPQCGPDMGPLVAAGISEASGRARTLDEYSGWFDRGEFYSSPQPTDI